jgi:predicted NBD/HSP70 family sugar kinase
MYLGVDIGGTKTLVASLDDNGVVADKYKFPTPQDYASFLPLLKDALVNLKTRDFVAATVAVPAVEIDREHGRAISFANLNWHDIDIASDVGELIDCPILIENDAKLAGLSEAMLVKDKYSRVLYVTVSTGIGYSFINNLEIDTSAGDGGGHTIMLDHDGQQVSWESLASGHAIVERFGKMAKDIDDDQTWRIISQDLAKGLIELISIFQPQVIVIGGSVGGYFSKFEKFLNEEVEKHSLALVNTPAIKAAERPDDAVIYGCYDLARRHYANG